MNVVGIEGLSVAQVQDEVRRGGKFVIFTWCISLLIITIKRGTDVHFIRAGQGAIGPGMPYTLLSLFLGWWGFPFGLIYTPMCIIQNLSGGKDVTAAMLEALALPAPAATGGEFGAPVPRPPPASGGLPPSSFGG